MSHHDEESIKNLKEEVLKERNKSNELAKKYDRTSGQLAIYMQRVTDLSTELERADRLGQKKAFAQVKQKASELITRVVGSDEHAVGLKDGLQSIIDYCEREVEKG